MLGSYGSQFGLPVNTMKDELVKRNMDAYHQSKADIVGEDRFGFGRLGNRLGQLAAAKAGLKQDKLPDHETTQYEIMSSAQDRFNKLRTDSPDLWQGMSSEDKALTYKRYLADAAADFDNFDLATQLNDEYTNAYNARVRQDLELRKLGIDTDDSLEAANRRAFDNRVHREHGKPVSVYPLFADDPNTAVSGMLMPDGSVRTRDPRTGRETTLQPGQFSPERPQWPPRGRADGSDRETTTKHAIGQRRDDIVNMTGQLAVGNSMYELLANVAQKHGSIEFLSQAGGVVEFTVGLVDNVAALTRTARNLRIPFVNSNNEQVGTLNGLDDKSIDAYLGHRTNRGILSDLEADFNESSQLQETFLSSAEWKANVVRLAYARARAREPGARQLSDNDIAQARAELGAMISNPEGFRRIMLGGLQGDMDKLEQSIALIPENERRGIFGAEGLARYEREKERFLNNYSGTDFGTAARPGRGLTEGGTSRGTDPAPAYEVGAPDEKGTPIYHNGQIVGYY